MTPIVARTRAGLAAARAALRQPCVLVPVAGTLDEGHRGLIRAARRHAGTAGSVAVAVAGVTPDDPAARDGGERAAAPGFALCAAEDVDLLFVPRPDQRIAEPGRVTVDPGPASRALGGSGDQAGLGGFLTVVLRLVSLIGPDAAVLDDRDAQRLFLVRQMVADLDLPVTVVAAASSRDPDGLPVSGRIARLSAAERATALAVPRALRAGRQAAGSGARAALRRARAELDAAASARPPLVTEYLAVVDPATFEPVRAEYAGSAIMLVAGTVGGTRLTDSTWLTLRDGQDGDRRRTVPVTVRGESG